MVWENFQTCFYVTTLNITAEMVTIIMTTGKQSSKTTFAYQSKILKSSVEMSSAAVVNHRSVYFKLGFVALSATQPLQLLLKLHLI